MKEIKAFVRGRAIDAVTQALMKDGTLDFSVSDAQGIAHGLPGHAYDMSAGMSEPFLPMKRIEIICKPENVTRLVETIPKAAASGKPALIELRIDPDAITPATTLSAIREKSLKSRR